MVEDLEILFDKDITYPVDESLISEIILTCKHNRGKTLKILIAEPRKQEKNKRRKMWPF